MTELHLHRGSETILIVEDDEDVREVARQFLEHLGYKIFAARNGLEALEVFREAESSVDLVVLDVVMPVLDGPETAASISAIRPDIPFIFVTSYTTGSNLRTLYSVKKAAILQKPFDMIQLVHKLREVLDRTK